MSLKRRLSSLELTVLGVVWKYGPRTAYAVMNEFVASPTSAYRSGAGSIYPLLHRLEAAGLVSASEAGERGEKLYEITELGLEELRNWFLLSIGADDFSCSLDVLRSRSYFLRTLSPVERDQFFEQALQGLKRLLARCRAQLREYERGSDPFSTMAMEGAVIETEARIKWLKRFRARARELS